MLFSESLPEDQAKLVPARVLAHLGDAVFHLFEREAEILTSTSAFDMHRKTTDRVSAANQAKLLDAILDRLNDRERDLVRQARNLKPGSARRSTQSSYRKSTAFEALLGYLYLTDLRRLTEILSWTKES